MLSSMWRATTAGLAAMFALVTTIFCASATFSGRMSMPRSPRATMTPSAAAMMASMFFSPARFSIFAITRRCSASSSASTARTASTSAALCTNDSARLSTPLRHAKRMSSTSFSVSTGRLMNAPGRYTAVPSNSVPALSAFAVSSVGLTIDCTSSSMAPYAMRIMEPALREEQSSR